MAFIKTLTYEESEGRLRREYDSALRRSGYIASVLRLQSLSPNMLRASMGIYTAVMHQDSSLSRMERELIATVVSAHNECFY
jgi:alkylhydroperoxidase family enzyme